MGIVYEVEHVHTGQRHALKVLTLQPGASADRFKREARATTSIQSDHIVRVTDADVAPELGGAPFLVMELLEGADLERTTGNQPASPADVIGWLRQVARALNKAHAAGIVHRDLKPENLFLTRREDGSALVKILDFGIAKMAADATVLTLSDSFLGTPGYMAPEQTDSKGPPVTLRADLYALGLISFKLLTGHSYWRGGSLAQLLAQILVDPMPLPSDRGSTLGPAFDAWFRRACDREASKRFASADEQVEALAVALGLPEQPRLPDSLSKPAVAATSEPPGTAATFNASSSDVKAGRKRISRRRWLAGGILGAVGALGIVATIARIESDSESRAVRALGNDTGIPSVHASLGQDPASVASPTPSPALSAGLAIDAAAPASASGPPPAIPKAAGSAAKHRGGPSAGTPPASPGSDTVWGER
jgi:serine/threonine protein kinase